MEVLLEKFREKKPAIVLVLKDAIDAVHCTVWATVEDFSVTVIVHFKFIY